MTNISHSCERIWIANPNKNEHFPDTKGKKTTKNRNLSNKVQVLLPIQAASLRRYFE